MTWSFLWAPKHCVSSSDTWRCLISSFTQKKNVWKRKESCYHGAFSLHAKWRNSVFHHAIHVCYVLPKDFTSNSFFYLFFFSNNLKGGARYLWMKELCWDIVKSRRWGLCAPVIQCTNSVFCSQHHLRLVLPVSLLPDSREQNFHQPFLFFLKTPGPTEAQMHWSNFVRTFKVSWH